MLIEYQTQSLPAANTVTGEMLARLYVGADVALEIRRRMKSKKTRGGDDASCCAREPGMLLPLSSSAMSPVSRAYCWKGGLGQKGGSYAVEPF